MPRYVVSERFLSKKTRSNDFSGNVAYIPKIFVTIDPVETITKTQSTITWQSNKVPVVNLWISYDGKPFELIAENLNNSGQFNFDWELYSAVTIFRVQSATNPEVRDDSNPFIYDWKIPVTLMWIGFDITPPVEPNNSLMWIGFDITPPVEPNNSLMWISEAYVPTTPTITKIDNTIVMT